MNLVEASVACKLAGMDYGQWHYLCEVLGVIEPPTAEEIRKHMHHRAKGSEHERRRNCPVTAYDKKGREITTYPSVEIAATVLKAQTSGIYAACNGRYYSSHGYQWRYAGDPPPGPLIHKRSGDVGIVALKKTCKHCNRPYVGTRKSRYCSDTCRAAVQVERSKAYQQRTHKKLELRKKVCENCGKSFETKSANARYCSDRCRYRANNKKRVSRQNRKGEKIA